MQYTRLGRSNLQVSRICLGTMHFGPVAPQEECFKIMDHALELGINFFDTANVYGGRGNHGHSEEIIGKWFSQRPGSREKVILATKVYGNMVDADLPNEERGISLYKVRKHCADSLRRLKTDHIDLYQVHEWDGQTPLEETLRVDATINTGFGAHIYRDRCRGASGLGGWSSTNSL